MFAEWMQLRLGAVARQIFARHTAKPIGFDSYLLNWRHISNPVVGRMHQMGVLSYNEG